MERVNPSADVGMFPPRPGLAGSSAALGESTNSARPIAGAQLGRELSALTAGCKNSLVGVWV